MRVDTEHLVAGLKEYFHTKEMVEKYYLPLGRRPIDPLLLVAFVTDAVGIVEKLAYDAKEVGFGKEKRDSIVQFLDDCVDFGWLAEKFDGYVIGKAVDGIVGMLNDVSKEWIKLKEKP